MAPPPAFCAISARHRSNLARLHSFTSSRSMSSSTTKYKLVFFCPPQYLPSIKTAIFTAGAGRAPGPGGYTECCFTTPGVGQFRPGDNAKPHIGEVGKVEEVGEVRCETLVVGSETVVKVVEALKGAHPYEEAGYDVFKLEDF